MQAAFTPLLAYLQGTLFKAALAFDIRVPALTYKSEYLALFALAGSLRKQQ